MGSLSCNSNRPSFLAIQYLLKIANGTCQVSSRLLAPKQDRPCWSILRERALLCAELSGRELTDWISMLAGPRWHQPSPSPAQPRTKSSLSADGIQTKELEFYHDQAAISFAVLFIVLRAAQRRWVSVFSLYFGNLLNILGARQVLLIVWASILMTTLPLSAG